MFKNKFRLPSPAIVISTIALGLVLGGTAVAAGTAGHPDKKADTKLIKALAPTLSVKHAATAGSATTADTANSATNATNADTAGNALNLGGVAAASYVQGPVEAVHSPSLMMGWTNIGMGMQATDYYKDPLGIVHLEGELSHTGSASGEVVFTLPVGYRPSAGQRFAVQGNGDGNTASLLVSTDGSVRMYGVTASGSTYSINGVTFRP